MLFDSGLDRIDFKCKCGRALWGVSIGEESLVCACGDLLTFTTGENFYDYYWVSKEICSSSLGRTIDGDKRNLC